ncbi:antibiotic resistance protein [Malaciobacter mytili LMG 24559]|uniref:Antibiotic resistance protein n=1 Tax=Malaciobacter mytili LMG 24559 TaxID=1032238 RepID=A0AAX2ACX8_9BACT|nr:pyridoxamine 5'-phosphate oxidase family protein [Malaciobacter mytili]AXH14913.1 nitroimidazol reductase (NimA) family protein [Malaciobacter mytili LMG 24559]RXK14872.1 antibiotic resistance protein [Malaciobacter mytili LMG 24559]
MRRKEFNIEDKQIILKILSSCEYGVLSLISENKPYSVALNFVYFQDKLYFHGAKEGRKVEAIRDNNKASFLVVKPYSLIPSYFSNTIAACPATQFFSSVFFEGEIKQIENKNKKAEVLNALMEKLQSEGGYEPIAYEKAMYKKMIEKTAVFEFTVLNLSCKVKVGQNLNNMQKNNMLEKLSNRNTQIDKQTIKVIKEFNKD